MKKIVSKLWCPTGNHYYTYSAMFKVKGPRGCYHCFMDLQRRNRYKNQKLEVSEWQ